jgi:transaldolase
LNTSLDALNIQIFADGADLQRMQQLAKLPYIKGFTTNPTIMKQAGIQNYEAFGREVLKAIPNFPISLEVFADDIPEMLAQAEYIATWGPNVNIKIPVTNSKGEFTGPIIRKLAEQGAVLNITAITTLEQVQKVSDCFPAEAKSIISVFAARNGECAFECCALLYPFSLPNLICNCCGPARVNYSI